MELNKLSKAKGILWYWHVLRRDNNYGLRRALDFKVIGRRRRGRPKMTWRRQVVKLVEEIGLKKESAIDRPR